MLFSSPCVYSQVCDSVHKRLKGLQAIRHGSKIGSNWHFSSNVIGKMDQNLACSEKRMGEGGVVHIGHNG